MLYYTCWASLVAQVVKNLPTMWETWVQSLGWEDPLEKGRATHSSILAWRIPWTVYSWCRKEVVMTEQLSLCVYIIHTYMHTHQMTALTTPSFILIYLIYCSVYFKFLKTYSEKLEKQF